MLARVSIIVYMPEHVYSRRPSVEYTSGVPSESQKLLTVFLTADTHVLPPLESAGKEWMEVSATW